MKVFSVTGQSAMAYEGIVPVQPEVATRHQLEYQANYLTFSRSYTVDVIYRCFRRCGYWRVPPG